MRFPKLKLTKPNLKGLKYKKNAKLAFFIPLILLVAFVGWILVGDEIKDNRKVYAEVAGHKIYEEEIKNLKGDNEDVSDRDAAVVLADKYLTEALAVEQGITVDDNEIRAQWGDSIERQKTEDKYAYQNKVNQVYFNKLAANNRGIYKGKFLITHFSRHVPYKSALLAENKAADPLLGNKGAIAKDKKYAQDLIDRLHADIQSEKITFEEAIEIEKKDPTVGEDAYPTLAHSGDFDTSKEANIAVRIDSSLQVGELSDPTVVRVFDSADGKSMAESYFMVVRLDEKSGNDSDQGFRQYVDEAMKRLGYKVYV